MISFLEGKIIYKPEPSSSKKKENFVILNVGGVGYKVFLSQKTLNQLPPLGSTLKLFSHLSVRQDKLDLYGFLTFEELQLFELIEGISGVGAKAALENSALGSLEKIKKEILSGNEEVLKGIPGIGKKKARAIMLELAGRIKELTKKETNEKISEETIEALVKLGFSRQKAKEALSKIPKEIKSIEERVKEALKILGK